MFSPTAHSDRFRNERGGIVYKFLTLALIAGLLFLVYLAHDPILRAFIEWWIVDEAPEEVQAIVVLSGDSVFGDRLRHGADLYRQGYAVRLILSGRAIRSNFSEAELMEREALAQGVPAGALLLVRHTDDSTLEEALALRQFLAEQEIRSIIVVTSNFHSRRARKIFRRVMRQTGVQVRVSASSDVRFNPRRWWKTRTGRKQMVLELLKFLNTLWELRNLPAPELSQPGTTEDPATSNRRRPAYRRQAPGPDFLPA